MASSSGLQSSYLKLDNLEEIYNSPIGDHIPQELRGQKAQNENQSLCPSFSLRERLMGFGACMAASVLCSVIAWVLVFKGDLNTFAVINTIANIFSVGSTFFLCGPLRQLKSMFKSYRWAATLAFLACLVLTFVFALAVKIPFLTIITVLLQYLAMTWYTLSYIPFARDAILACFGCR
jgi:magnesium-transporting ATPase (P-type)